MKEIKDLITTLAKNKDEIYSTLCKVVEVNEAKRVCHVEPLNGDAKIFNVRLQSVVESSIGLVLFPKNGAVVGVTFLTKDLAFVALTNEIEKIKLNIGGLSMFIDENNFDAIAKSMTLEGETLDVTNENTVYNVSDTFKVIGAQMAQITAQNVEINAITTINGQTDINGATTIIGTTTVTGATTINGVATINGAATIAGAATLAAGAAISGAVTLNGGAGGGIPLVNPLVAEINQIKTDLNLLKTIFTNWTPAANDGGAALRAGANAWRGQTLNPTVAATISNPQFTQ